MKKRVADTDACGDHEAKERRFDPCSNIIDGLFHEALETVDKKALVREWEGQRIAGRVVATNDDGVAEVERGGDLLIGIFIEHAASFVLEIGGQRILGGPHVFSEGGGYLPLKVPMICWQYSMMRVVCDRPTVLTLLYGFILDPSTRRALACRGAFQRLPNGRTVIYKSCGAAEYSTSLREVGSMVEL